MMKSNVLSRRLAPLLCAAGALLASCAWAALPALEAKPTDAFFAAYAPEKAPPAGPLLLQPGDRLAIVGDSITEQKIYSRLMEDYLTVCVPELKVTARQYGWSGETAEGFLRRMTNDCLRYKPTVATTCYGMNDYKYRPFDAANGEWYRARYTAVARAFKAAGTRLVLGSAGSVGKVASWVKSANGTLEDHNVSLCKMRNIALETAAAEGARFADVYWPLLTGGFEARAKYGADYALNGHDGVHPGGAGHLVMAYAYLKAMGLDGDLGTIRVDLKGGTATATGGHEVAGCKDGEVKLLSRRYPFCAAGASNRDDSVRSGMTVVPFNRELNRLCLVVQGASAASYKVTWGAESRVYPAAQLAAGVNLAEDFESNPFSAAFAKVDAAVAAKQAYETEQVKKVFHGPEGKADLEAAVARTEAARAPLAKAIQDAFVPVAHTVRIEAM